MLLQTHPHLGDPGPLLTILKLWGWCDRMRLTRPPLVELVPEKPGPSGSALDGPLR